MLHAVACMNDLMFLSRIMEATKALSVPLRSVKSAEKLLEACNGAERTLVFLDLDDTRLDAISLARSLRTASPAVDASVYGFVSHVNEDRIAEAGPDLFDEVFSRGQFVRVLPSLIEGQR